MTVGELAALSPLILVSVTAVVLMLLAAFYRNHRAQFWVYQLGLLATLVSVHWLPERALSVTPLLLIDDFFSFFARLFVLTGMVVGVMAAQYFRQRAHEYVPPEECYVLLAICVLGALVLSGAQHFAGFFLGVELIGVASFVLVAYPSGATSALNALQRRSLEAGLKYLLLSAVASAFLLFGIALLYVQFGTLDFVDMQRALAGTILPGNVVMLAGLALLLIGVAFKLSIVPFHMWTPDVYQGAPTPVTALIATLSKGALIAVLLRYLVMGRALDTDSMVLAITVLATLTMLGGNLLALMQHNIKRLLAYSSIAHVGYLLVAFLAVGLVEPSGDGVALQASAFYLVAYIITTLGAFSIVNTVSDRGGDLSDYGLRHYRGLFWRSPWLSGCFVLILLSLAGIPLTVGFIGKFYIFAAGAEAQLWFPLLVVILGSAIGLYYYLRVVLIMVQQGEAPADQPRGERWLAYGLTALLVALGIYPAPVIAWLPLL